MANEKGRLSVASISPLLEMALVTVTAAWLVRFLRNGPQDRGAWLAVPFVFLSAAVVPTLLRKRSLGEIGLRLERPGLTFRTVCRACLVVFPVLFCGILLLKRYGIQLPLCPVIPDKRWLSWLFYQFMYVAVAEEVFFRGYIQSSVLRLVSTATDKSLAFLELMSIIISAFVFAVFHSVVLGSPISIITFFPGLILGWLFVKTKSLLAPILFHGLANSGYGFIAAVLT